MRKSLIQALWPLLLASGLLAAPAPAATQADYAREARWAEQILPSILVGDPLELALPSGRKFLAIWTPSLNAAAGVILVHGMGVHPDWGPIHSLRTRLSDQGYPTLSVQMPVLSAEARPADYPVLFPEAAERLAAAVAFLRAKGLKKIAVVSHSMGARMTDHFLARASDPGVMAWVAIGISGEISRAAASKVAVLDLYGEKDYPAVLEHAGKRAATIRATPGSAQVEVAGADHFFGGREEDLLRHVRLFLDRHLK
jgi:dienelactone hydrolase